MPEIEPAPFLFLRFLDDEGLEGCEIMTQPSHRSGESAAKLQLPEHEVDRHRQAGGGEDFLPNGSQEILAGNALLHPFAQGAIQICLFDVFLTIEKHCGWQKAFSSQ